MRVVALLLVLVIAARSGAQEGAGRPYWVSTASAAGVALRNATAAVAIEDWTGAARVLQEVFDKYVTAFAKTGQPNSYVGARHRAVQLLTTMPTAVRTEYERLSGPPAERALRAALAGRDRAGLLDIVRRYEGTQAGLRAVLALADSAILRGRAAEARLLLARVRQLHPDKAQRPDVLKRLALAAARDHAVGGPKPEGVEKLFDPGRIDALDSHAWPMMGGDARRTRRADVPRFHDILYHFDIDVPDRRYNHPPPPAQSFHLRRRRSYRADWDNYWRAFNPVHPVLARGYLVFGTGRQIEAVNLYTGDSHWRYPPRTEPNAKGRTNLSVLFSPVVADGIVYGALEIPVDYHAQRLQSVPITYYLPSRRLVAISLDTGDVLWSHEDHVLNRVNDKRLKELTIVGPPLVRGDRIYVGACRERTHLFHHYLIAIDRRTGKLIYETRISQGQQELNLFGRKLNEAACTPVAEADGVLYYGTNQGVVAAIDAMLGTPLWATTYPVVPIPSTYLWFEAPRRWPRFDNGPPLIVGDNVVIAPTDGTQIMTLQRSTGRVLWRKRFVGDEEFGFRPRVLQGSDGERVFVSGNSGVAAVWLKGRGGSAAGDTAWLQRFPSDTDTGAGRGLLARGELWIPSYTAIYRYDPVTGKILAPIHLRAGRDERAYVNLTAGDGVLITAGREFLCARYSEGEVLTLVKSRMRSHPDEVGPILRAADVYLATGRLSLAVERYKQAGAFAAARGIQAAELRARQGLHRALLARAEERMDQGVAMREFDAAIKAAPDRQTSLRARLHLDALLAVRSGVEMSAWRLRNLRELEREYGADHMDEAGRTRRGWALRQQARILVQLTQTPQAIAVLHKLVENDPDGPDGRRASRELRAILLKQGRHHYLRYEKRARRLFDAALRSGDLEALERGLLIYSNAEAAAQATLQLATRRLRGGDPTAAAQVLQRFLVERPDAPQVPQALLLMVRALHQRHSYGPAYSALQRLKRLHGDATVRRDDGARVPAATVAAEWLKKKPYPQIAESARRRDLQPGLVTRFEKHFGRGSFVDVPDLLGRRPEALREAVLLRMGRTLLALDSRGGDELYRIRFDRYDPRGPLVLADGRLIAVTEHDVFAFDATTGRELVKQRIPDRGKGLALLEHKGQVFLLYRQRDGRLGVAALHSDDVSPIWTSVIPTDNATERVDPRYTIGYRDRLLLFSERSVHLTVVNTTSGRIENRVAVRGHPRARLAVPPRLLPDGRVVVGLTMQKKTGGFRWQHSYAVHLLDPSQPAERVEIWQYSPPPDGENRYLHLVNVIGEHVVALDDACGAAVIRLRDGKQVAWADRLPIGDMTPRRPQLTANQAMHDSLLLVTTRARSGSPARLSAFEMPSLRRRYSQALTTSRETAEVIDSDGVLGLVLMPNVQRGTRPRIRLYDPLSARLLQEIVPGDGRMNWFTAKVQNGILIVSPAGNAAYGYGPK